MVLYRHWFKGGAARLDYEFIPTAVFSTPNLGTVGLTEEAARKKYKDIEIYRSVFKPMKHTMTGRDEKTMMKLVVDRASDRVIGLHMVGPEAGEIVQGRPSPLRPAQPRLSSMRPSAFIPLPPKNL